MDIFDAVAVVLGLTGAVLGGLGWRKARSATAACRSLAEPATAITPVTASVAGEGAAVRGSPAPSATRALSNAPEASNDAQTAALVLRPGSTAGHELPTNQGSGSGLIGVFVVNQGPAVARELRLSATFPDGVVRSSETHRSLSAHKEMTLFAQVLPQDFGASASMDVLYRVAYRDGNGEQVLERSVRLDGGWKGPWKTFLATDPSVVARDGERVSPPDASATR